MTRPVEFGLAFLGTRNCGTSAEVLQLRRSENSASDGEMLEDRVPGSNAVLVSGVTRRYGSAWVLRGVDARFPSGSMTVVEGANGAGKSTLMGIVGGLVHPTGGEVVWAMSGVSVREKRAAIGWVGHESSCYRDLTALENVELVAVACGVSPSLACSSLARVGATAYIGRHVGTLSRGQKQRVALARGIVHSPDLLLLDEPFTGLDAKGCEALEAILVEERDRGAVVIVVSHDRELAGRLGAEKLVLERGRVRREMQFL